MTIDVNLKTLNTQNNALCLTLRQNQYQRSASERGGDKIHRRAAETARKDLWRRAWARPKESLGSNLRIPVQ